MKVFSRSEPTIDEISKTACIVSPDETLSTIETFILNERPGAYLRFGDGDVYLFQGKDDSYQSSRARLRREMKECFTLKGAGCIKSLSIHSRLYGHEKNMTPGNHLSSDDAATELLKAVYPYFVGYRIFSPVALHYMASYHPVQAHNFLRLLKQHAVLFAGNENVQPDIVQKLFGKVTHIKTPPNNAYDKIDFIEQETRRVLDKRSEFGVVIVSMGCAGRVLIKRLYNRHYPFFFFDFGSLLDGICGLNTRTWLEMSPINYDVLLKDL